MNLNIQKIIFATIYLKNIFWLHKIIMLVFIKIELYYERNFSNIMRNVSLTLRFFNKKKLKNSVTLNIYLMMISTILFHIWISELFILMNLSNRTMFNAKSNFLLICTTTSRTKYENSLQLLEFFKKSKYLFWCMKKEYRIRLNDVNSITTMKTKITTNLIHQKKTNSIKKTTTKIKIKINKISKINKFKLLILILIAIVITMMITKIKNVIIEKIMKNEKILSMIHSIINSIHQLLI